MVDLNSYIQLYLKTAYEYQQKIDMAVTQLEANQVSEEAIETIYIAAHSLKSQSTIMKYTEMAEVCSIIEKIFHDLKNTHGAPSLGLIAHLRVAAVSILECLRSIEHHNTEISMVELRKRILESVSQ